MSSMLRRPTSAVVATSSSATTITASQRTFFAEQNLIASMFTLACSVGCWGAWGNNYANVSRFGTWRFRSTIDDNILVADYQFARLVGSAFGVVFWWFVMGPSKYRRNKSLESHPGWKRFGPL